MVILNGYGGLGHIPRQISDFNIRKMIRIYSELHVNIHIEQAVNIPLPALMSFVNIHITGFSSSIQEACLFDLYTILFPYISTIILFRLYSKR